VTIVAFWSFFTISSQKFQFFCIYWNCYCFYNIHLSSDCACIKNL